MPNNSWIMHIVERLRAQKSHHSALNDEDLKLGTIDHCLAWFWKLPGSKDEYDVITRYSAWFKMAASRQLKIKSHQICKYYISMNRKFNLEQLFLLCQGMKMYSMWVIWAKRCKLWRHHKILQKLKLVKYASIVYQWIGN